MKAQLTKLFGYCSVCGVYLFYFRDHSVESILHYKSLHPIRSPTNKSPQLKHTVEETSDGPGLCATREDVELSIVVGHLGKRHPVVVAEVLELVVH